MLKRQFLIPLLVYFIQTMPSAMSQDTDSLNDWHYNSSFVDTDASLHDYDPKEQNSVEFQPSSSQNYITDELPSDGQDSITEEQSTEMQDYSSETISSDVPDFSTEELSSNVEDYINDLEPLIIQDFDLEVDCKGFTCIRKCCQNDTYFKVSHCKFAEQERFLWKPSFYEMNNLDQKVPSPENLKFVYGRMDCESMPLRPQLEPNDTFHLLPDGKLYVPIFQQSYSAEKYCIDIFDFGHGEPEEPVALLCFGETKDCSIARNYVIPLLLLVSCVFLGITLAVYISVPELRGKLHGRCLMSMVSSLLVTYIMMTFLQWEIDYISEEVCLICATVKHTTLLASFFWLNIMCFDMWRSLSSFRRASETSARSMQRFALYSLYAWGSPLIIGLVAIIIDVLPESYGSIIRPDYLKPPNICWFNDRKSQWLYFYMIVLVLLIANIFFFLSVAYIIYRSQKDPTLQTARSRNRDRLWLYGKLFLVMGVTWIAEIISFQEGTCQAWIFTDAINALQGFTIFLVFVCKKKTRQMVARKLSIISRNFSSSWGNQTSTTRHNDNSISHNTNSTAVSRTPESRRLVMCDLSSASPRSPHGRLNVVTSREKRLCDTTFTNDKKPPANIAGTYQLNAEECHSLDGKKEARLDENILSEGIRSSKDDTTQMLPNALLRNTSNLEAALGVCDQSDDIPVCSIHEDMSEEQELNGNYSDCPVSRQNDGDAHTEKAESIQCSGESLPLVTSENPMKACSTEETFIINENSPMIIAGNAYDVSQEKPER